MTLRVPAGVVIGGVAIGGRFVSPEDLPGMAAAADDDAGALAVIELIAREADKAAAAQERIERKFQDDPRRYAERRAQAEDRREFWDAALDQASSVLQEPEPEEYADEWEVGFDYNGAAGRTSDVDINIRLARRDGAAFGAREAVAVLRAFRDNLGNGLANPVPAGYRMASINWRRPHTGGGWRPRGGSGTMEDVENFNAVLYSQYDNEMAWDLMPFGDVRLGSVKP